MQSVQVKFWDGLQGVQGIQEASGTPGSVGLQGLQPLTAYRCQAVWLDNSTPFAESGISAFTTLAAGSVTLQLRNITRQGYNYAVHYNAASTYALSNAVLSINGGQVFQGTIQGNTIAFTVTGLDAGTAYLYTVTAEDIYQESVTATGTVTTTVVNEVNMYYDSRTEDSVTFDLSYLHDHAFAGGWVNVWNSTQDPSTDNPISSEIWLDGDTQVKVTGLADGTAYKFQAGMTVEDGSGSQSTVYSSVLTATTNKHDYSRDYFTVNKGGVIKFYKNKSDGKSWDIEYSSDGVSWTKHSIQYRSSEKQYLNNITVSGGKTYIKTRSYDLDSDDYVHMTTTYAATVSGNIMSLLYTGTPGDWIKQTSFPDGRNFYRLFMNWTKLTDASKLILQATALPEYAYCEMFSGCTALVNPPAEIPATAFPFMSATKMFDGCTALTSTPKMEVRSARSGAYSSFSAVFAGCSALTSAENITLHVGGIYDNLFNSCTRLTTLPKLEGSGYMYCDGMFAVCTSLEKGLDITAVTDGSFEIMYSDSTSLKEAYAPTLATWSYTKGWLNNVAGSGVLHADAAVAGIIPTDDTGGCPSGWNIDIL